jgi:1-acyl-sn-glycerol-3-phosphate acyltransferase
MESSIARSGRVQRVSEVLQALRDWSERMGEHVSREDLLHLEPYHVGLAMQRFIDPEQRITDWSEDPDARDPELIEALLQAVRPLARRVFDLRVEGLEHVPTEGPALIVANHNGGLLPLDTLFTLLALWDGLGPERELNMLGHDLLGADEVGRRIFTGLGIIRAHPERAARALEAGRLVLVYPSSEHESFRPFWERDRVPDVDRMGFIRLALQQGVPIIPLVTAGTHEQLVVLTRGRRLARAMGLRRMLRAETFPIVWALPWGITSGYVPYLPLPAQTTLRFGPPIAWPELDPSAAEERAACHRCRDEVRAVMQGMLDELYAERVPVLGERAPRLRARARRVRERVERRLASDRPDST